VILFPSFSRWTHPFSWSWRCGGHAWREPHDFLWT